MSIFSTRFVGDELKILTKVIFGILPVSYSTNAAAATTTSFWHRVIVNGENGVETFNVIFLQQGSCVLLHLFNSKNTKLGFLNPFPCNTFSSSFLIQKTRDKRMSRWRLQPQTNNVRPITNQTCNQRQ